MRNVGFFAPTELEEALRLLAEYRTNATVLAGGTDLVSKINYYELKPDNLLYIGNLGLDYIREDNGELFVGAATPTAKIAASELVATKAAALSQAARLSGSTAIRNAATVGGNLANASPAADLASALLAMDAEIHLTSAGEKRVVAIADFFTGPGETLRRPDELLHEIRVPVPKGKTVFLKLGRRKALTLSVANASVQLMMDGTRCEDARIVLGAMAPTPLRCKTAEGSIKGRTLDMESTADCASVAVGESNPIDDQRASAWYRKKVGETLIARALARLAGAGN
jgi:CO/xanthine dehydrogenase FAD-binding subunit